MERHLRLKLENGTFAGVTPTRSSIMSAIRGKSNKTTEGSLRLALVRAGVAGWRLHARDVPGRPDFYFDVEKLAVFVDGCFWHGCSRCGHVPKTRSEFWGEKFRRNKARDRRVNRTLRRDGIRVIRFWEHSFKDQTQRDRAINRIRKALGM
ncbi:very short patch repair endonuclease [Edaphobacter bradus]|uniref:very short patch repair endonuclease n=1 Tax=Edaphobacter bradus TaxID=2259016 RepID=UPI0037C19CD4